VVPHEGYSCFRVAVTPTRPRFRAGPCCKVLAGSQLRQEKWTTEARSGWCRRGGGCRLLLAFGIRYTFFRRYAVADKGRWRLALALREYCSFASSDCIDEGGCIEATDYGRSVRGFIICRLPPAIVWWEQAGTQPSCDARNPVLIHNMVYCIGSWWREWLATPIPRSMQSHAQGKRVWEGKVAGGWRWHWR